MSALNILRIAGRRTQRFMPSPVRYALKSLYHGTLLPLTYGSVSRNDADILAANGLKSAPPPAMRHRVHGAPDLASFLTVGKQNFDDIRAGIEMAGFALNSETKVLDFGCGSGRTLLWWANMTPRPVLFATDIDGDAIGWVATHLPVETNINGLNPPLPYADGQMDVVYAISVLTHLDEAAQDAWLEELQRITKVGGVVLLSVHSEQSNALLDKVDRDKLSAEGFLFRRDYSLSSRIFGSGYQNTYHTDSYVKNHWAKFFKIVGRIGMGAQDLIVMRRED
jgi:ubiquinone/menaquinone biosynthesis C-methylase UbiE